MQQRRNSLAGRLSLFETKIAENEMHRASTTSRRTSRRSSLSHVPVPLPDAPSANTNGNGYNNKPPARPRRKVRRSSLNAQVTMFESMIAENAKHQAQCKSFLTNVAVNAPPGKASCKSTIVVNPDEFTASTAMESDMGTPQGMYEYNMPNRTEVVPVQEHGIPRNLSIRLGHGDDDTSIASQYSLEGPTYCWKCGKGNDVGIGVVKSIDGNGGRVTPTNVYPEPHDHVSSNEHSKSSPEEDNYDASRLLVDWDTQMSAVKRRIARERKGTINIGYPVKLKDRMKAFARNGTAPKPVPLI